MGGGGCGSEERERLGARGRDGGGGGGRGQGGEHTIFSEAVCVDQDCCAGYSHTACPSPECISPNLSFLQDFSCKVCLNLHSPTSSVPMKIETFNSH